MAARTITLVTGANSGIGYEIVKAFLQAETPYHIIAGCRTTAKAKEAVEALKSEVPNSPSTIEPIEVDLDSDESIQSAHSQIKSGSGRVDTLINNAGATFDLEYLRGNVGLRDCFTKAYNVNVAGTHVLTATFMDLLLKSSSPRLLFIAGLSQITTAAEKYWPTPPQPAGWPKNIDFETIGYRCSKVALNMLMLDWNHKLQADGVKVFGVGPGMVATNLGNMKEKAIEMGMGHPSVSGQFIKRVADGERDADVGKLVNKDGISPW